MRVTLSSQLVALTWLSVACASPPPPADAPTETATASTEPDADNADSVETDANAAATAEPGTEGAAESSSAPAGATEGEEPTAIKRDPGEETRTTKVIQDIVRQNRQLVRDCYEKALKKNKGLQGDLTVHFVIGAKGDVKTAELNRERSTLTEPEVVDCAVAALKGIRFPPSSRGFESQVNYPFNLNP